MPFRAALLLSLLLTFSTPANPFVLNDDGAWSWFEDERAIVSNHWLLVGSVANGSKDPARKGDVDLIAHDLTTRQITRITLHKNLEADDHNSPALIVLPDHRVLAMYSKHGPENRIYYRLSHPNDPTKWDDERTFIPTTKSRVTYSNLHYLPNENDGKGRLYNFFRGLDDTFKPSWMVSDDLAQTWHVGGLLIDSAPEKHSRQRPYVKYASDGNSIHFAFTEGHPRNFDNSIYHALYRDGQVHRTDGTPIKPLKAGPITPPDATRVFQGDPNNVAWIHDLALDDAGHPRLVYSVQKDSANLPPRQGGQDHRYRFARFDGTRWHDREIAHAGSRLYPGEDDYTGGITLHPTRPSTLFISTNVHPTTGQPLASKHYELFRGERKDNDDSWTWTPLTPGASADHLRPIVPKWNTDKTPLLYLRGTYTTYTKYALEVVLHTLD